MKTETANFLVNQLNPVLKQSHSFIRRLRVDYDNEDIEMLNLFKATIYRVPYGSRNIIEVMNEISENARY